MNQKLKKEHKENKIFLLTEQLRRNQTLSDEENTELLESQDEIALEHLYETAREVQKQYYGNKIYVRGLIEFTNYCRNNCFYCAIRRDNQKIQRYRLNKDEIYACAEEGYALGFRTFVLQGGEDAYLCLFYNRKTGRNYFLFKVTLSGYCNHAVFW